MYDKYCDFNYIDEKNNAKILYCSSSHKNSKIENILNDDIKSIWLSESNLPQIIIIDVSKIKKIPIKKQFDFFGVYLWHQYLSNPKQIEFYLANSLNKFFLVGIFELNFQNGYQIFKIDNSNYNIDVEGKIKYIKIIINENFGGARTYLNQVFLLDNINYHNGRKENKL